jgi:class 3 adenylate cyclase
LDHSPFTQIESSLSELRNLIDRLGGTVNRQHQTMITTRAEMAQAAAEQTNEELARLLIYVQRGLEDLERRVQAKEREHAQLRALQEVGAVVNSSLELNEVLEVVMDAIISLTKAERAILLLIDEESRQPEVQLARNMDKETIERSESFEISRTIVRNVAEMGEAVVTMNAQADPRFATQESIISYNLRSILCVPLKTKDTLTGVIYVDNRVVSGIFGEADRDLLATFANQAAVAIENARLFREIRKNLAEITEMKDLMDSVFASIASGVITIDNRDQIALYNQAAEHILGLPVDSTLQQAYQIVLSTLGLAVEPLIDRVRSNGDTQNAEMDIYVSKRPGLTTLNLTFSPLVDAVRDTSGGGVAMVMEDVSEKKRMESVRRYLPPALVDQVRDLDAAQRPQRRNMSVLFADIRGFSTYSELMDPERLIQVINGYFTEAVAAISHYQGVTDKFMGDAVMALFNTPLNPQVDHEARAVRTGLMILETMKSYHAQLPSNRHLHFGIGIHTGVAVIGNVGSALRKDYSAIGDAVNMAKRLQEIASPGQLLISADTYQQVKEFVVAEPLPLMTVKGRQALEQLYSVTAAR